MSDVDWKLVSVESVRGVLVVSVVVCIVGELETICELFVEFAVIDAAELVVIDSDKSGFDEEVVNEEVVVVNEEDWVITVLVEVDKVVVEVVSDVRIEEVSNWEVWDVEVSVDEVCMVLEVVFVFDSLVVVVLIVEVNRGDVVLIVRVVVWVEVLFELLEVVVAIKLDVWLESVVDFWSVELVVVAFVVAKEDVVDLVLKIGGVPVGRTESVPEP